tara:strand:- start:612 stop:812 length:201 start_codon:yes stop_codon:yes gene_type:complete
MTDPRVSEPLAATQFKDKKPRSERVMDRANKAVDEGRMRKAARLENRSIKIEDREMGRPKFKASKY